MKWLRTIVLFNQGAVLSSPDWEAVHASYVRSIQSIHHPVGSGMLRLRKKVRLPGNIWARNGVGYLRSQFLNHIVETEKWKPEGDVVLGRDRESPPFLLYPSLEPHTEPVACGFGEFDFVTDTPNGLRVAIEWETGNVSSSHRSMNKLTIALASGLIQAGVLIVPSRACYDHLTDRIGNIEELSGYWLCGRPPSIEFQPDFWPSPLSSMHELTDDPAVSYLPLGKDGRAAQGKVRKRKAQRKAARKLRLQTERTDPQEL